MLTPAQKRALMADFASWSGGFPPDSSHEISIYVTHSLPADLGIHDQDATDWLTSQSLSGEWSDPELAEADADAKGGDIDSIRPSERFWC